MDPTTARTLVMSFPWKMSCQRDLDEAWFLGTKQAFVQLPWEILNAPVSMYALRERTPVSENYEHGEWVVSSQKVGCVLQ